MPYFQIDHLCHKTSIMKQLCLLVFAAFILFSCKSKSPQVNPTDALNGKWKFMGSIEKNFSGNLAADSPELALDAATSRVSGTTGCNTVMGSYAVNGSAFSFGPLAGTRKMCPNMEIENYLLPFLSNVGSYEIKDGRLFLYDKADKAKYIVFSKVKPT